MMVALEEPAPEKPPLTPRTSRARIRGRSPVRARPSEYSGDEKEEGYARRPPLAPRFETPFARYPSVPKLSLLARGFRPRSFSDGGASLYVAPPRPAPMRPRAAPSPPAPKTGPPAYPMAPVPRPPAPPGVPPPAPPAAAPLPARFGRTAIQKYWRDAFGWSNPETRLRWTEGRLVGRSSRRQRLFLPIRA